MFSLTDKLPDGNFYAQAETAVKMKVSGTETRWLIANPRYDT